MEPIKNMKYAPIELELTQNINFSYKFEPKSISDPDGLAQLIQEFSPAWDQELDVDVPFPIQFAPKITTDNKAGIFKPPAKTEQQTAFYGEPKFWGGAKDRSLNFKLTYMADGGEWTYQKIAAIAHFSKSLLYMNKLAEVQAAQDSGAQEEGRIMVPPILVIENLYGAVETMSTWALETVSITHGDKIIRHEEGVFGPIKTEIDFTCKEWTRLGDAGRKIDPQLVLDGLVEKTTALWY